MLLGFAFLPVPAFAQDAHSQAIAAAAAGAPMDYFGIYWNPAIMALSAGSPKAWTVASGGSYFDTSNSGSAILRFDSDAAAQSSQDPVNHFQQYLGIFGVQNGGLAGGMLFDQELNDSLSQGGLAFFHDRDNHNLQTGAYNFNTYLHSTQQVANLILSYATPFPLGSLPFFSIGGSLKYHDGLQYQQTLLTGSYSQGVTTGYNFTKTTSSSGLGLSTDAGFLAKITDSIQVGMMFQNLQSNFTWKAQRQVITLNPTTGAETVFSTTDVNVDSPYPYAAKLGMLAAPPDKNIALIGEVDWTQGQTDWRFGLERYYPENHFVVRFGTFADRVSNSQLWTFGGGYFQDSVSVDLSFLTRSLPSVQDSIAFGLGLDAEVRF